MAEFNVTIGELINKADSLNDLNEQFKIKVGDLVDLEGSLNNMWEGDARTTFHNAFTGDVQQMGNFYKAVKIYVDTLQAAAEKYQTTEAANVEIANTRSYH